MKDRPEPTSERANQLFFIFTNGAKLAQNNGKEGNTKKHKLKEDLTFKKHC